MADAVVAVKLEALGDAATVEALRRVETGIGRVELSLDLLEDLLLFLGERHGRPWYSGGAPDSSAARLAIFGYQTVPHVIVARKPWSNNARSLHRPIGPALEVADRARRRLARPASCCAGPHVSRHK